MGGLVLSRFGRMPKRGESISFDNLVFKVLRADSRRLHMLQVARKK
ncbi:MAG TPA: transporter associated domain-containing protein [Burkholderiales bacterium]|nr:transporter associated domain-containing protein [Burkholderiales bacterium]